MARDKRATSSFDPDEEIRLATFVVNGDLFAIDIMRIQEIVRPLPVTPVPKASAGMLGVVDLRGTVLPLFDLRTRFDCPPAPPEDRAKVRHLIVSVDGRLMGISVDAVHDVVTVTRAQLRLGVFRGEAAELFLGVCTVGAKLALLMDLRRVLAGTDTIPLAALLGSAGKEHLE